MCPVGVGTSRSTNTLKTGEAKLWIFLVGVNQYQDERLSSLRYPALDCQGLGEALAKATQGFPSKEVIIHHDFAAVPPKLDTVRASLKQIISQTESHDTILFYFSGHGVLEPNNQQPILCLADTQKDNLLATGLGLQELLQMLETSSAHQQLICLDACHSGAMLPRGARDEEEQGSPFAPLNSTPQVEQVLRQRAAQSKGFCALLSCDQGQKSWEFPGLGHGVFTYYLMRGLLGEAADPQGVIEADGLYKYVYRQTLQYIDKTNQQLRLINQLHRNRGETQLHPEYPLQTPKRIVEGVGELILGLKPALAGSRPRRQAIVVDAISGSQASFALSKVLRGAGGFELEYWPRPGKAWTEVRSAIQACLRKPSTSERELLTILVTKEIVTGLLYLRGRIEEIEDGEAWLVLEDDVRLSRSWLRQELRRSGITQQIVVLDCPGATSLADWVEDLQLDLERGQCLIAAAAPTEEPELFSQALSETLTVADPQVGLTVAGWIAQLQTALAGTGITLHVWLSGAQDVIDILPGNIASVSQDLEELEPSGSLIPAVVEAKSQGRIQAFKKLLMPLVGAIGPTLLRRVSAQAPSTSNHRLQMLVASVLACASVMGVRHLGMLQPWELQAYDHLMQLRPADELPDQRLLIVTVDDADIQYQIQKKMNMRWSLSDQALAKLLQKLEQYQPRTIGIDIYRDFSVDPNYPDLATSLQQDKRLFAVCKVSAPEDGVSNGTFPPPEVPKERLSFGDFVADSDEIPRRQLLNLTPPLKSPCAANLAFSLQLARHYLDAQGIKSQINPQGYLQIGNVVFKQLKSHTSGYQGVDASGYQILLNYRSVPSLSKIADQVSLTEVLNDQINPELISSVKNRIVLIGVTTPNSGDYWKNPYSASAPDNEKQIPGVFVQAHMVSHILSAVLDRRPLFWWWSARVEALWVWGWSLLGGIIAWRIRSPLYLGLAVAIALLTLFGICFGIFTHAGWIPLVPSALALVFCAVVLKVLPYTHVKNSKKRWKSEL